MNSNIPFKDYLEKKIIETADALKQLQDVPNLKQKIAQELFDHFYPEKK